MTPRPVGLPRLVYLAHVSTFTFSKRSRTALETCHPDLQLILAETLRRSPVDFIVTEGYRTRERQYRLFKKGLSRVDGRTRVGKHNVSPSMAADVAVYAADKEMRRRVLYDPVHLAVVVGVAFAVAHDLLERGLVTHALRSGGNWDRDGVFVFDQSLIDLPHLELVAADSD